MKSNPNLLGNSIYIPCLLLILALSLLIQLFFFFKKTYENKTFHYRRNLQVQLDAYRL